MAYQSQRNPLIPRLPETPQQSDTPQDRLSKARQMTAPRKVYTPDQYHSLSGHQRAALKAGLDPYTEGVETMTFDQMKALGVQKSLDTTNQSLAKRGYKQIEPEPEPAFGNYVVPSFAD